MVFTDALFHVVYQTYSNTQQLKGMILVIENVFMELRIKIFIK